MAVKNCFIRGSVVRYVQLPSEHVDTQLLEDATRRGAPSACMHGSGLLNIYRILGCSQAVMYHSAYLVFFERPLVVMLETIVQSNIQETIAGPS